MASSSHPVRDSSSEDELGANTLIAHDVDHVSYILGPLCTEPLLFSHITESFILLDGFNLPITTNWFSISFRPKELRSWPKPAPEYEEWLDRVLEQWKHELRYWGIYDMIMFSKLNFSSTIDMFVALMGFWNTAINAFVFPFSIMSPSLFDVVVMLGLPIIGEDILSLYEERFEDLSCLVFKENSSYGKFMEEHKWEQGAISITERNVFIFFWLYKFFLCSKSLSMVNEFSYYVSAIISSRPMNLGTLFLSSFYEGMKMWVDQLKSRDTKAIPSPIWFLFLWINEYFPEFYRDYSISTESIPNASTYSLRYKTVPIQTFSAFQLVDRLFKMPPRLYLEACPFIYRSCGPY